MTVQLSEGSLFTIMKGGTVDKPILQILGNKHISSAGANERFRLLVSDGQHLNSFAMLATQLNGRLKSGELADYTVVQINRFITSLVNNSNKGFKRVMIILELEVLSPGSEIGKKLGSPVTLPEDAVCVKTNEPQSAPAASRSAALPKHSSGSNGPIARPSPARNAIAHSPADMHTYPIASLNPYQNRWVIRARVFNKSPIRTWSNARGEGKLFSMDLVDESGEIRATAFKDQCDKFYDVIEVNNVYFISRCTLKTANKKFTSIKHDYELSFTDDTQVIPCHEETGNIPTLCFEFMPFEQVVTQEVNALVDIIGVSRFANEVQTLIARTTNRELKKRDVTLVDSTNNAITLTLWGVQAESFDGNRHPVIAVKGGRVNEFGGAKSVSISMNSVMQLDPDVPDAHRLRGWYDSGGADAEVKNLSASTNTTSSTFSAATWMTLHESKAQRLGLGDGPDYFTCKAWVLVVRSENSIYKACPTEKCNKKITDLQNGMYRCEKCAQEFPNYKYRLLLSVAIGDWTSKQWVSAFQDVAEPILGVTAEQLGHLQEIDTDGYISTIGKAAFKSYIFRIRCKSETYNDETRLKTVIMNATPIKFKEYNKYLLEKIKKAAGRA